MTGARKFKGSDRVRYLGDPNRKRWATVRRDTDISGTVIRYDCGYVAWVSDVPETGRGVVFEKVHWSHEKYLDFLAPSGDPKEEL